MLVPKERLELQHVPGLAPLAEPPGQEMVRPEQTRQQGRWGQPERLLAVHSRVLFVVYLVLGQAQELEQQGHQRQQPKQW